MSIKLVVSDMDGTLFDRDEKMPDLVREFAPYLQQRGILFAVATGRSHELSQKFISVLSPTAPCVYANGALITRADGSVIQDIQFSLAPIAPLLEQAVAQGMSVVISSGGKPDTVVEVTDWVRLQQQSFGIYMHAHHPTPQEWATMSAYKVLIKDSARQIGRICRPLDSLSDICAFTEYETGAAEIVPPNMNKAIGIGKLAETLQIDLADVMAIGDYVNDIEMMTMVGMGVAVGNAMDEVKQRAKYVCSAAGALGVQEAILRFCQ